MALKLELEQWQSACEAFDNKDHDTSLRIFSKMADNAKMHFNIGLILASIDDHERAVAAYAVSTRMDSYFAVAYFQMGVSLFVMNDMVGASEAFDQAYQKLRGNLVINYSQLGLAFRLYACEVLFNRGICLLNLGKIDAGLTDLYHAQKAKQTEEHDIIDQAVRDRGKGYSVYSIPPGVLYRPSELRLRQLRGELQGSDMFVAMDKLGLNTKRSHNHLSPMTVGISRNNSVLLPRGASRQKSPAAAMAMASSTSTPMPMYSRSTPATTPPPFQDRSTTPTSTSSSANVKQNSPSARMPAYPTSRPFHSTDTRRKESNAFSPVSAPDDWTDVSQPSNSSTSSFSSSFRYRADGRRVDSGFESAHEDRYSSSSSGRNSTKSHKTNRYSPPPVPPIPGSQSAQDDFDPMSYGQFDQDDGGYSSLPHAPMHERDRMHDRFNSNSNNNNNAAAYEADARRGSSPRPFSPQSSTSSSSKEGGKIKIKVHYTDTRILLVPATVSFDELFAMIQSKFQAPPTLRLQYKDEDDEMVLMIDDDDLFMARQISRQRGDGGIEKMEVWCSS